ncbi:peptide chain release factor N(5)-glutamine methyltransferase [Knoellia aerolata]|uniref:Release factor glutamine methyltransferase n=1 Tax=Knoellia aerolata DSM 18566 TaxID=1385519 RepID=A0A0A0JVH3_9MICO|nr:peptide chain release factor N(5)-glutamine methyltransferase [Knoellia aerolata]KGN40032.1 methylase [Knoellia aerolata DSM 18566]
MSDLRDAVRGATGRLADAGVASPEHDAVALAAHALGVGPGEVRRLMVLGAPVPEAYAGLVAERAARVPLQHLTGRTWFRGLELEVGPGVFVPRPETEVVAGWAIDAARACLEAGVGEPVVVDLCAGSGAIAFSVKAEVPQARVHAVEVSDLAVAWATSNRDRLGLDVDLVHGDAVTAFPELAGVDVVVSNPPYIPTTAEPVDPEVRDHDPPVALYGGSEDGLAIPRLVAARAAGLLRPGGVLVMEHADSQGETLPRALLATGSWASVEDRRDLAGRPRATVAVRA